MEYKFELQDGLSVSEIRLSAIFNTKYHKNEYVGQEVNKSPRFNNKICFFSEWEQFLLTKFFFRVS